MSARGEAVSVDHSVVFGKNEDSRFGISGLFVRSSPVILGKGEAEGRRTYLGFRRDTSNFYPVEPKPKQTFVTLFRLLVLDAFGNGNGTYHQSLLRLCRSPQQDQQG